MSLFIALEDIREPDRRLVGGKSFALSRLQSQGFTVPAGLCLTTAAYREYLRSTGLEQRIQQELARKPFGDMRWEELWDAALRIRHMFVQTPIPQRLLDRMISRIGTRFDHGPVAVRSSAPGEDEAGASFAGLHESFLNLTGAQAILASVKKVWASLWSDAALLYRHELGLDPAVSSMAVLIQDIVLGERSGIAFSRSPAASAEEVVIEAVYGLNQGLVDGSLEPDRWTVDRQARAMLSHTEGTRQAAMRPVPNGVQRQELSEEQAGKPPLSEEEVLDVARLALRAEASFGSAQDIEWTYTGQRLVLLQARPITTQAGDGDTRAWYLSLRRSLEELTRLRQRIEEEHLPAMQAEAERLAAEEPTALSDAELAAAIDHRHHRLDVWKSLYWREFIPMAHGVRLFGQIYNDTLQPEDPFAFLHLLEGDRLLGLERNNRLLSLASIIRNDPELSEDLRQGRAADNQEFTRGLEEFWNRFGTLFCHEASCTRDKADLIGLLLKLADRPGTERPAVNAAAPVRAGEFLDHFQGQARTDAERLLDLARASYRLRDNDNIVLGRIEAQLIKALEEGRHRLARLSGAGLEHLDWQAVADGLRHPDQPLTEPSPEARTRPELKLSPRQLQGQPAGPGLASGPARVIRSPADLRRFEAGEILVCDAVDPTMTFIVPLAAGIVERRGGMLIHGAIIAREYGLPCVTGIPRATSLLETGQQLSVDGYLGLVTVHDPIDQPPG